MNSKNQDLGLPPVFPDGSPPAKLEFLGLGVHAASVEEVHAFIARHIFQKRKAVILNLNIHCVHLALRREWLRRFLNEAPLVFCDGDGVRWGIRILGMKPPPKITYDRWIWDLCRFCEQRKFRLFFLGARPGVAQKAAERLQQACPQLRIAGVHHGFFNHQGLENDKVVDAINRSEADILMVGFGMPSQEKWLSENWERLSAHIFLTGGAVFDYAAGNLKRAPDWVIRAHLEWLHRLIQEPRRLFRRYALEIPDFFLRIFLEALKRKTRPQ